MIIATAGHVDHGKTSLVKQLTGVDTDRTEEEQRRGLSINLGYAYRDNGAELPIGFIDVPGHSRFLNTMIAGVSGIDLGMLVVAADDGPMPQTREHIDILNLLGVERFLLVVSKIDRVERSRVQEVTDATRALLPAESPVFAVSNLDGTGITELADALDRLSANIRAEVETRRFRLSLDRAFHVKGAGLVVTGTAAAGAVAVDDELLLQPLGRPVRVRGIHAQDRAVERAVAGQRVALNISGAIERHELQRGDWLVDRRAELTSVRFDARLQLLPGLPFQPKHLAPVKLYIGARRVEARLFFIDESKGLVQLLLDGPVLCHRGDRFLLRDYSEAVLLGGGMVLDPQAPRYRKSRENRIALLQALQAPEPGVAARCVLLEQGEWLDWDRFTESWNLSDTEAERVQNELIEEACLAHEQKSATLLISAARWQEMKEELIELLQQWHEQYPETEGISPAHFRDGLAPRHSRPLISELLLELIKSGSFEMRGGLLCAVGFQLSVSEAEQSAWRSVEAALQKAGRELPTEHSLRELLGLSESLFGQVLGSAARAGRLHRIGDGRLALPSTLNEFASLATRCAESSGGFTVKEFRDASGVGRNLCIEVLEYFDQLRFTQRDGQNRKILDPDLPAARFKG